MMNCPHCNVHIDEHPASRCLRGWVASSVMGWEVIDGKDGLPAHTLTDKGEHIYLLLDLGPMWFPDLDIVAAWEVVEKMHHSDCYMTINTGGREEIVWDAEFRCYPCDEEAEPLIVIGRGHTAPHAICRAAIKAGE